MGAWDLERKGEKTGENHDIDPDLGLSGDGLGGGDQEGGYPHVYGGI